MKLDFSLINKLKQQLRLQTNLEEGCTCIAEQEELQSEDMVALDEETPSVTGRELGLLYSVCTGLLTTGEEQDFGAIAKLVVDYLGAFCCSIWEVNNSQTRETIRLAFADDSSGESTEGLANLDFEVSSLVMGTGEPIVTSDIRANKQIPKIPTVDPIGVLSIPLTNRMENMGALSIWRRTGQDEKTITSLDIELAATLAQLLTLGLDYKRKYSEHHNNQTLKQELHVASEIQLGLAPRNFQKISGASLETRTMAAHQVGGDYVDIITTQAGRLGIVIGDVMGKGVPAALFMVMTRTVFRAIAKRGGLPHQVLNEVNEALFDDLSNQGRFVTMGYALYDPDRKLLLYANAGHMPPFVYRASEDEFFVLKVKGIYIGGKPDVSYALKSFQLQIGDTVAFFSDGVKEAMNSKREQFGDQRIMDTMRKFSLYDAGGLMDCLSLALAEFTEGAPQSDDITMAILKIQ